MSDKTEMTVERARALLDSATSGPWTTNRIDEEGGAILWQIQQDVDPYDVVGYTDTDLHNPRARHDGRLMAAAPDLASAYIAAEERVRVLEGALRALLVSAPSGDDLRMLAVATNGVDMTNGSEHGKAVHDQCDALTEARRAARAALAPTETP